MCCKASETKKMCFSCPLKQNNYYEKLIWKSWRRLTVALSDVRQKKEKPWPVREQKSSETPLALAVTFTAASWPQREFKQSLIEFMWHMTEAVEAEAYAILWLKLLHRGTIYMQKVLEVSPEDPMCWYLNTI